MKASFYPVIFLFLLVYGCTNEFRDEISSRTFETIDGVRIEGSGIFDDSLLVIIFMSPDCPVCINYTQVIDSIRSSFNNEKLKLVIVYPGDFYTRDELKVFRRKYHFNFISLMDKENIFANSLNASVTPEVRVIQDAQIIYSGAIDDRMAAIGKKRQVVSNHYLRDALGDIFNGEKPAINHVEPVGCLIE